MNSYYGCYRTNIFTDVKCNDWTIENEKTWNNQDNFLSDWKASAFYTNGLISDNNIKLIYNLLYANYGNSPIASSDENRFKAKVFSMLFQYAPTWVIKSEIQTKLRALDLDSGDLFTGTKAIYNSALNPQTTPTTGSLTELEYINQQNTTNYKRSKLDAYANLWELLRSDITDSFIKKFEKLFIQIASPDRPLIYVTETEEI